MQLYHSPEKFLYYRDEMRACRDRTAEFLALAGGARAPCTVPQRAAIARALGANLPPAQVQRVVLHELELAQQAATNAHAALHWHEAARLYAQRHCAPAALASRTAAVALNEIERKLHYVSAQYEAVLRLAASQSETIGTIERNIESIHTRIDSSQRELEDAAPRQYHTWRLHRHIVPRTLAGRLQCVFGGLLALNLLFIYTVLL